MSKEYRILEDKENRIVTINDYKFDGFIDDSVCPKCLSNKFYIYEYDTYFCPYCNIWLENNCSDSDCEYCKNRPEKPLDF